MKKRVLAAFLAVSAFLGGCQILEQKQETPTVTLTLANNLPAGNCTSQAIDWFAAEVEKRSGGRIHVEVYHNSELGDSPSCLEQLRYGGIDIVKTDESALANYVAEYSAFIMPYVYQDTEHFRKVHRSEIGMGILRGSAMAENQMYGLTYYDGGARGFFSKKPIHSPADMSGMLVRVQNSRLMMAMVEALGANPVALEYDEVMGALIKGGVDAAENSLVNYAQEGYSSVAPYYIEDGHTRVADILVMSTVMRSKLSEEDLLMIDEAALESWEYQQKLWDEAEQQVREQLAEQQTAVFTPDDALLQEFRSACEPIWASCDGGAYLDLIDRIVAAGRI